MGALSRAKAIDPTQIGNIKTLTKTLAELKVPTGAARLTEFLNAVGSARAPTEAQITRLKGTLKLLSDYKPTAATRNVQALSTFFNTISNIKAPSEATLTRLSKLFTVLASAKEIPGAGKIAADLDHVAQAAGRAGNAFKEMPSRMGAFAPAAARAQRATQGLHDEVSKAPKHAANAARSYGAINSSLGLLGDRFKLSYQAGTLFSAFFSAFTVGQFLKGIYDANIQLLKLQKALLFATGSLRGRGRRRRTSSSPSPMTSVWPSEQDHRGLRRASPSRPRRPASTSTTNKIFHGVGRPLQIVGANSEPDRTRLLRPDADDAEGQGRLGRVQPPDR
jgi:hypothetical protein